VSKIAKYWMLNCRLSKEHLKALKKLKDLEVIKSMSEGVRCAVNEYLRVQSNLNNDLRKLMKVKSK